MQNSDSLAFENRIAEINKFLQKYNIAPIAENDYKNPRLLSVLDRRKKGNEYGTAILSLSALLRSDDAKELSFRYFGH